MIIEETIGGGTPDLTASGFFRVLPNTALNWNDGTSGTNRLQSDFSSGITLVSQLAGFFFKEFSTDLDGDTVPTEIVGALIRNIQLTASPRTEDEEESGGEIIFRISPFLMYNIFDPSTVTFADMESWVFNDTESNSKFDVLDLEYSDKSGDAGVELVCGFDARQISTFNSEGESDVSLVDITAVGLMCELLTVTNIKTDPSDILFYPNGGSFDPAFQYIQV